jgi:pilus assembly protein CpaB
MRIGVIVSLAASAVLGAGALIMAQVLTPAAAPQVQPMAMRLPGGATPVVVAASPLAYGVRLEAKHLTIVQYPADSAPIGAYRSVEALLGDSTAAPVVLVPLAQKEPVLSSKLSGPGARPSLSAAITDGKRAYTIRISDVAGVGGHALPGDHADVVLTREVPDGPQPAIDSSKRHARSEILVQDVRLLGVDLNADPSSAQAALGTTATLEVTVEEAQKLAVAAEAGTLSLALRRPGATEVAAARPISVSDLSNAGRIQRPASQRAPRPQALESQSSVLVTQGSESALVRVARGPGV